MVKKGCGQSCDGTIKLTLSEEWTNGINWFLVCWWRFITVKSWLNIYWVGMVKNVCGQSGHETLKLTVQNWTEEITWFFCMLVQIQEGRKLIQSFLSVPCQRWQWLFSSFDPKTCIFFFLFIHIHMYSLNNYINTYKREIKSIKSGTHKNNL